MHMTSQRASGIAFMFISLGVMVITLLFVLCFQTEWTYLLCASVYAIKVVIERKYGIISPLSLALLAAYCALFIAQLMGFDYTGYAGLLIFSWLFVVVAALLMIGKPFTTFYSHGAGMPFIHKVISVIWLATYGVSMVATVLLIPNPLFMVLPALFCILGGAATLYISFCWCGTAFERKTQYRTAELQFSQIDNDSEDFNVFCDFFTMNVIMDAQHDLPYDCLDTMIPKHRELERGLGEDAAIFVCKIDGRMIGSIRCILGQPGKKIPAESYMQASFDPLRQAGPIMFVGRLAIDEAYRHRPEVINGLFAGFINLALERDMAYIVSEGFKLSLPIYLKLGFETLFTKKDPRFETKNGLGLTVFPVLLDFESFIMAKPDEKDDRLGLMGIVNPYLAERFYKRTVVRQFIRKLRKKHRLAGIKAVRGAMAPALTA